MSKLMANAVALTNAGCIRDQNEDSFLLNGEVVSERPSAACRADGAQTLVCAVCDGIGGAFGGEIASGAAVAAIRDHEPVLIDGDFAEAAVRQVIETANEAVCEKSRSSKCVMGTTLAFLAWAGGTVTAANVGDSRIYRYREAVLQRISHDHTRKQFFEDAGLGGSFYNPNDEHTLTQHLGIPTEEMLIEPYIATDAPQEKDVYLLCSDGLSDMVSEEEIREILTAYAPDEAADRLMKRALDAGGHDNITLILISFEKQ